MFNQSISFRFLSRSYNFTFNIGGNSELERQFLAGQWYFEIASQTHPLGEIRGQIERSLLVYGRLDGAASNSSGVLVGDYSLRDPVSELAVEIDHTVNDPEDAQLSFNGRADEYEFEEADTPIREKHIDFDNNRNVIRFNPFCSGWCSLFSSQPALFEGLASVSVEGSENIEGPVLYSDAPPYITHHAR